MVASIFAAAAAAAALSGMLGLGLGRNRGGFGGQDRGAGARIRRLCRPGLRLTSLGFVLLSHVLPHNL